MSHLHHEMDRFITRCWQGIFSVVLKPETEKRWSFMAHTGHTILRIQELAGRLAVQFEDDVDPNNYVCYVTHDKDEKGENFGIQSYFGSYTDHDRFLREINLGWELHGATMFKRPEKQTIG